MLKRFGTLTRSKNKNYEDIPFSCSIRFLDDSEPINVTYKKTTKGQWILDHVCKELDLMEKDYFGLRYVDDSKQRHWVDPHKLIHKQLKDVTPPVLCFRVKFYPSNPLKLQEEITRYFLFLQLRRDLHHGRLLCSPEEGNHLAALILQSEVGDSGELAPGYASQFQILPKKSPDQDEEIEEIHERLRGQMPPYAESQFLSHASKLDTYGVDPHPVKDQRGNQMYLGVTHSGIVTFQDGRRTHFYRWDQVNKVTFEGKTFIVHVVMDEAENGDVILKRRKHACGFKCPTGAACRHLWKCAVEQQYFFTLGRTEKAPSVVSSGGGLFGRGSRFRFSGRCQHEVESASSLNVREPPQFVRSTSNPLLELRRCNASTTTRSSTAAAAATGPVRLGGTLEEPVADVAGHVVLESKLPFNEKLDNLTAVELGAFSGYSEDRGDYGDELPQLANGSLRSGSVKLDPSSRGSVLSSHDSTKTSSYGSRSTLKSNSTQLSIGGSIESMVESRKSLSKTLSTGSNRTGSSGSLGAQDLSEFVANGLDHTDAASDLDSQIAELQNELDRCRRSVTPPSSARSNAAVLSEQPAELGWETPQQNSIVPQEKVNQLLESTAEGGGKAAASMRGKDGDSGSCARKCACTFLIVFTICSLVLLVIAALILETNVNVPVISSLRQFPELQDFKNRRYIPTKSSIQAAISSWFKG